MGKREDRLLDKLSVLYDQRKMIKAQIEVYVGLGKIGVDEGFALLRILDDTKVDEVVG